MLKTKHINYRNIVRIGSLTCVFHCLATPFILLAVPMVGSWFHNPVIEFSLLTFSVLCGMAIVIRGYCKHKKKHVYSLFSLGVVFWILHVVTDMFLIWGTQLYLVMGTSLVLLSYMLNHKWSSCCTNNHH